MKNTKKLFKKGSSTGRYGLSAKKQGFSLLELVVIMAMTSIMTSVTVVAISSTKNKTELDTSANEVKSILREVQNYALTGKISGSESCVEYKFEAISSSENYEIIGLNDSGTVCGFSVNYNLNGGVVFENNVDISFLAPYATSGASDIILRKGTSITHVCVNSAGLVEKKNSCP
jgi:Tfp pilus assembly protein FimT